jgi:hypothetical protein
MTRRAAVICAECGRASFARLVGERVVVSTADGKCVCGHGEYIPVSRPDDTERGSEATEATDTDSTVDRGEFG